MTDLLLITAPFTQLNTPYPATTYLSGTLKAKGYKVSQSDLGMETYLSLFSHQGLSALFKQLEQHSLEATDTLFYQRRNVYLQTIDTVIAFLQGKQPELARTIASRNVLPEGNRFAELDYLEWSFGTMGISDKARHLANLYLEDIADFITEFVDPDFGVSRYAERIAQSPPTFDSILDRLTLPLTLVEQTMLQLLEGHIQRTHPLIVGFSIPFPGNLIATLRCAAFLREHHPSITVVMGGGYVNTELRELSDVRFFSYTHFMTFDDGERPLEQLLEFVKHNHPLPFPFKRTLYLDNDVIRYSDECLHRDYQQHELAAPDYTDLPLDSYLSVIELANPMHSLWTDGRWLKLTMAHGCYWGKCTFCDVGLDYIGRYDPVKASLLVDRMEELMASTGLTGFHFVDEAAPPALMRDVALEIIHRKLAVTWWTNIRFEKNFTPDVCKLLAASGCIAVSGGLEVASDRLLQRIEKGVTIEQVSKVTHAFTDAGILVHAYLMFGYPTQTEQETIDSLEVVRQLFEMGSIQSGFWHQFSLTTHSPIAKEPEAYGITIGENETSFARNDLDYTDDTGMDHSAYHDGLRTALYNYMHGIG
ncbi:MAG: radical SAM protein, partial [Flavobacteriales bacterium]|nr:radical SAM protein [Flavobacteriales bacterium]